MYRRRFCVRWGEEIDIENIETPESNLGPHLTIHPIPLVISEHILTAELIQKRIAIAKLVVLGQYAFNR